MQSNYIKHAKQDQISGQQTSCIAKYGQGLHKVKPNIYREPLPFATPHTHLIVDSPASLQSPKSLPLHHHSRVQAVAWNHHVPQVLLSGSFDHTVVMNERIPSHTGFKWSVSGDVETIAWDLHTEHSFVVCVYTVSILSYFHFLFSKSVLKMVQLKVLISELLSLINLLTQRQVSLFMHTIKLFARSPIILWHQIAKKSRESREMREEEKGRRSPSRESREKRVDDRRR
ncbi:hypothetical protein HYC85_029475 [Camellia sinensis]|uniref:Peroxin-7 n=1 Tax=Camellia sinensis TaxID=4442 RepID=A0A7J7G213_CAMSI|nr:hypothetical protein HYC85_029475 [Camellia sinensis]